MNDDLSSATWRGSPTPTPDNITELHARLAAAAQRDGVLDIAYRLVDSPVGAAARRRDRTRAGPSRLRHEGHDAVLQTSGRQGQPTHPARTRPAGRRRARTRRVFRRRQQGFRRRRWTGGCRPGSAAPCCTTCPTSATATPPATPPWPSSPEIPKAVRAVGSACATNPLPVVVPCHRVVRSDGAMGGYLGGVEAKRTLLTLEAAA